MGFAGATGWLGLAFAWVAAASAAAFLASSSGQAVVVIADNAKAVANVMVMNLIMEISFE